MPEGMRARRFYGKGRITINRMRYRMRKMKKLKMPGLILICFLLSACGSEKEAAIPDTEKPDYAVEEEISPDDQKEAEEQQEIVDEAEADSENGDGQTESQEEAFASGKRIEVVSAQKADIPKKADEGGREITAEEMQYFSEFVQTDHNYGFLLSFYDTPADVNLNEVCYNGLGASSVSGISEEEKEAYKETVEWGDIYTDFFRITTAQLNEFLLEKTGLSYEQMHDTLNWTYLPEYDAYYSDHGDTNYRIFNCTGGYTVDEKFFVLRMEPGTFDPSEDDYFSGYHQMDYELVLEKCDDTYRFRSNRLILEEGLIEDQSFTVNLSPIGEVTFASFEPDVEKDPLADVSFSIIQDGYEIRQLDGVFESNNIRANEEFQKIEAVAFADYDEDGITDIIMILDYDFASGPNAAETHSEIRIYKGEYREYSKGDYFYTQRYQEDLSESITAKFSEPTIRGVLDYIKILL